MHTTEKAYPFSKSMMLNIIYDTLERLDITVISSNSERGRICLKSNDTGLVLKIDTVYPQQTVTVCAETQSPDSDDGLVAAFFDEIASTISSSEAKKYLLK